MAKVKFGLNGSYRTRINNKWRIAVLSNLSKLGIEIDKNKTKIVDLESIVEEYKIDIPKLVDLYDLEKQKIQSRKDQPFSKQQKQASVKIEAKKSRAIESNSSNPKPIGYVSRCRKDEPINLDPDVFYKSWRWRELRLIVLDVCGRYCCSCGENPRHDNQVVLHVDHIQPLRLHPELALDITNLQVLCEACNQGKSWFNTEDYRTEEQRNKLISMKLTYS